MMSTLTKKFKVSLLALILGLSFAVLSFGNELKIAHQQNSVLFGSSDLQQNEETKNVQRSANQLHENKQSMQKKRRIQDPSDHYFCGIGYADASESCAHPCPSGSTSE